MVARRDARLVRQVNHPGAVTDGGDDRCLQPRLGRVVATIWPDRQCSQRSQRLLAPHEQGMSSNARELSGVLLTVQAALPSLRGKRVLVETDNKATQAYVNHLGGRSRFLNSIARRLWTMCYSNNILLSAVHRPGKVNQRADLLSRWRKDHSDIRLPPTSFRKVQELFGPHSVDLFATRDNRPLPRFVSWRPDPESVATDAFMFPLKGENPYCFPSVACIPRPLREVLHQQATVTLVAPDWLT